MRRTYLIALVVLTILGTLVGATLAWVKLAGRPTTVRGVIASETAPLVADPAVVRRFRTLGYTLRLDPRGLPGDGRHRLLALAAFKARHATLAPAARAVPVFPILFGEGSTAEMTDLASTTGGRTFDARTGSLGEAFRDIRGYQ